MWMYLLLNLDRARAEEGEAPADAPAEEAAPADDAPIPGDEIDVQSSLPVAEAREALNRSLRAEGYLRAERRGDTVVYTHRLPYHPQVVVHDDGWIEMRRAPIRIRPPNVDYADEARFSDWLPCLTIIATARCIAPGGLLISERKLAPLREEVYGESGDEVRRLNDALAQAAMEDRLGRQLPAQLAAIWGDAALSEAARRERLLALWDSRTDTPEGEAARQAIEAFLDGVVQRSAAPFTAAELATFEQRRTAPRPLRLR